MILFTGGGAIPACTAGGIPACLAAGLQGGGIPACLAGFQAHTQGWSWGGSGPGHTQGGSWGGSGQGECLLRGGVLARGGASSGGCLLQGVYRPPPVMGTAAGSMHPTGMHSCCYPCMSSVKFELKRIFSVWCKKAWVNKTSKLSSFF